MNHAPATWPKPLLLIAITIGAAIALIDRVGHLDLILDSLTGMFAALGASIAVARLTFGFADTRERALWQCVLALFTLAALGEFLEPFDGRIEETFRLTSLDDALILAIGPIMFWLTAKIDPTPTLARLAAIVAFALQIGGTSLKLLAEKYKFSKTPMYFSASK